MNECVNAVCQLNEQITNKSKKEQMLEGYVHCDFIYGLRPHLIHCIACGCIHT